MGVFYLMFFGRGSYTDQFQFFSVNSLRLSRRSYKAICSLLLPLLDLEASGCGLTVN